MFFSKSTIKETMESLRELTETPGGSAAACAGAIGGQPADTDNIAEDKIDGLFAFLTMFQTDEDRIPADDVQPGESDPSDLF